jgi:hypothetical protein
MAKSKQTSLDKLRQRSEDRFATRLWFTKLSRDCQCFVLDSCALYFSKETTIPSLTKLHKIVVEILAEDFPNDAEFIPAERTFRSWLQRQRESGMLSKEKTLSQPASTKKQAVSKRKTV